ncbi:MAG: hypothetical protein ACFFKA_00275 [Candidatus Thorarchaeota archaeon]
MNKEKYNDGIFWLWILFLIAMVIISCDHRLESKRVEPQRWSRDFNFAPYANRTISKIYYDSDIVIKFIEGDSIIISSYKYSMTITK